MKIKDIMTHDVELAGPDDTLQKAAQCMLDLDIGVLPVGEQDRLVGMITDRDLAVRGIAQGKGPSAKVREVMSKELLYCFADDDVAHVGQNMGDRSGACPWLIAASVWSESSRSATLPRRASRRPACRRCAASRNRAGSTRNRPKRTEPPSGIAARASGFYPQEIRAGRLAV